MSYTDTEYAELLGAFLGDGWIESRGTALYICGSPTEDRHYYDCYLGDIFSRVFVPVVPRSFPYWGVYGVVSYRQQIVKRAVSMGFCPGEKAKTVRIPDYIFAMKRQDLFAAVLRGLFDADGTFWCHKKNNPGATNWEKNYNCVPRLGFSVVSKSLAADVERVLQKLSIHCTITTTPPRNVNRRNNSRIYRVYINKKKDIERFYEVVGSSNLRHISRYLVWKLYGHLPSGTTIDKRLMMISEAVFH